MQFGTFSIGLALAATVASIVCYLLAGMRQDAPGRDKLTRAGRILFFVAAAGVFGAAATLGTLLVTHRFDVAYVFFHSARAMAPLYWFPAFWAGQEGSFLLWAFWISVLGIVLARRSGGAERRVMPVYSFTLLFLLSLLVIRSPFLPLDTQGLPTPTEGMGLNPNLENYWMAIHPPVMFLGFASLSAVFAFAVAALFWKDGDNWLRRALPWGLFGFAVLALAMMMGGRWAYEMLGWGGFWGWDPVEVGPFIPWLGLVAFLHAAQVQKVRGGLHKTTLFFAMLPFVTAMYESFLTRTGVLDKFSVHSFSTLGGTANNVLLGGLLASVAVSVGLLLIRKTPSETHLLASQVPPATGRLGTAPPDPNSGGAGISSTPLPLREGQGVGSSLLDAPTSREFGFLSAVVLLTLSAVVTLVGLSSPLLTALGMKLHLATHVATVKEDFYNRAMFPLGVLLAIGLGVGPHLAWRNRGGPDSRKLLTAYAASAFAALAFFALTQKLHVQIPRNLVVPELLLWTACAFAIVSNVLLLVKVAPSGSPRIGGGGGFRHVWTVGGTLAHIGSAVLLVGVVCLVTFTKKDADVVLVKNEPKHVLGGQYAMVYKGQSGNYQKDKDNALLFDVASRDGKERFTARLPFALRATEGGDKKLFGHPAIASRLSGDLYVALKDGPDEFYPRGRYVESLKLGQTQTFGPYTVQFDRFERRPQDVALINIGQMPDVFPITAVLNVTFHGKKTTLRPQYIIRKDMPGQPQSPELNLPGGWKIAFAGMNAGSADAANPNAGADSEKGSFVLRPDGPVVEAFQLEITTRPAVNLIWLGTLLLVGGGFLSMGRRIRELRANPVVEEAPALPAPPELGVGGPSSARRTAKRGRVSVSQKPAPTNFAAGRKGR